MAEKLKPKRRPVYVGTLYSVDTPEGPVDTQRQAIGVDPRFGLVTATSRSALTRREYLERPKGIKSAPCDRLWYTRRRKDYDGANWYHDLDDARVVLDYSSNPPRAWFSAPTVRICNQSGAFLCG